MSNASFCDHFSPVIPPPPPIPSLVRTVAARVSGRGARSSTRYSLGGAGRCAVTPEASPDTIQVCPPDWVDEIRTNTLYRKIQRQLSLEETEATVTRNQ